MPEDQPAYAPLVAVMGAVSALVFSTLGAAYGTARSATGIAAMAILRPELIMKGIIPVVMAGVISIYGLIVAAMTVVGVESVVATMAFKRLGAGLCVGFCGLGAGFAIGIVGDVGVRAMAQQPKMFVAMILMLIFSEVFALFGMIVAILLVYN